MNTFSNIKELIAALNKEQKLLTEMFKKRKELSYKYDMALEMLEHDENRIEYLLSRSVIRENGNFLEIDDTFLEFFEKVLEVNEEINTFYINENIENVKQNIIYYFNEPNESRKYDYLKKIKNTLRKLGTITLRNVVDLKRNIDTTFKNEPNYKNKKTKLEYLDKKRQDITKLIDQTEKLITEDEETFFKTATDEELNRILIQLKVQLGKCTHNLIELEKQIMDFLNQIKYQSDVIEKLRLIKYLKDQFILQTTTDIDSILTANKSVIFEPNPVYPLRLSLEYLQADEEAFASIVKIAKRVKAGVNLQRPIAEKISNEYLDTLTEEEIQINLEEVKNGFVASSYNLFEFVMSYDFAKDVSFDERVTIYCQLVSQYETIFEVTDKVEAKRDIEFAMVYPK
jgi:hypothetical protein